MGCSLEIFERLGFSLSSGRALETMMPPGMLGSPYSPRGGRTPKEERKKEETGGEERAPTADGPDIAKSLGIIPPPIFNHP